MITLELLHEILAYDKITGEITWKPRPEVMFAGVTVEERQACADTWNANNAGKSAFNRLDSRGYPITSFAGKQVHMHRVIWWMTTGKKPKKVVAFKDNNKTNLKWANLTHVGRAQSPSIRKMHSKNTTGFAGVSPTGNKVNPYMAHFTLDNKRYHVGVFATAEEAAAARGAMIADYKGL